MFKNLNAELSRVGKKKLTLAETINVSPQTIYRKLSGEIPLTLKECKAIRNGHFPGMKLEYLFAEEGEEVATENGGHYQYT